MGIESMATLSLNAKITPEQMALVDEFIDTHYPGMNRAEFVRQCIANEMAKQGIEWPHVEFIGNEKRRGKRGIPWNPEKTRWENS